MERRGIARECRSCEGALLLRQQGIASLLLLLLLSISSLHFIILVDECGQRILCHGRGLLLRWWRLCCLPLALAVEPLLRGIAHILEIDRPPKLTWLQYVLAYACRFLLINPLYHDS